MSFGQIRTASVIAYPYLWSREARSGETEGRKSRPTVVALRIASEKGGDELILLPLTTKDPGKDREAVEVPDREKRLAGLGEHHRIWIILDEYNFDIVGGSYYLNRLSR